MANRVSGTLPPDLLADLDRLGKDARLSRSEILRDVVRRGVAAARLERALEAYRPRQVSLGRASEMAGLVVTVFIDELRRAGIVRDLGACQLRQNFEWAKSA